MEQEEYTKEEIDWSYIEFVDNQDVLDLIEKKPGGIIALLDEACMFPRSTNETFAQKLYQTFKDNKRFSKPKLARSDFTIFHYAGEVTYQTDLFLEKNKDYVVAEHQALLSASQCRFVSGLFPPLSEDSSKSSKFSSIGSRFKQQLQSLLETLSATEPHYIRCVKPNNLLKPAIFENSNVLQQLRCGGVMEAIRISCAGFPTRRTFREFVDRFRILAPAILNGSCDEMTASKNLLEKANLKGYQIGKTKVFLRAGQMAELDNRRNEMLGRSATIIQKKAKSYLARKCFLSLKTAATDIQTLCRGGLARQLYESMRRQAASIRIQTYNRRRAARKSYKELCYASITIQAGFRGMLARRELFFKRQTRASVIIQSKSRQYLCSIHFTRMKMAAVTTQCVCRAELAMRELQKLKKAARETQALQAAKEELEKQVDELTRMLQQEKTIRVSIEEVNARETTKLHSALADLQSQFDNRTREMAELQSTLGDIQSQFEAKTQELAKLQSELENIQIQFNETKELLNIEQEIASKSAEEVRNIREAAASDTALIERLTEENMKLKALEEAKSQDNMPLQSTSEDIQFQLNKKQEPAENSAYEVPVSQEVAVIDTQLIEKLTNENVKLKDLAESKTEENAKLLSSLEEIQLQLNETKELLIKEQGTVKKEAEVSGIVETPLVNNALVEKLMAENEKLKAVDEAKTQENEKLLTALVELQNRFKETNTLISRDNEEANMPLVGLATQDDPGINTELIEKLSAENYKLKSSLAELQVPLKETNILVFKDSGDAEKVTSDVPATQNAPGIDTGLIERLSAENEKLKALVSSLEAKIDESEKKYQETSRISEERLSKALESETKMLDLNKSVQRLKEKLSTMESEGQILRRLASVNTPSTHVQSDFAMRKTLSNNNLPNGHRIIEGAKEQQSASAVVKDYANSDPRLRRSSLQGHQESVDALIVCVSKNTGFSHGKPTAAFTIYKCLLHWKSFEAERTSIFDRLVQLIGSALEHEDDKRHMAYWLSNSSCLLFLLQRSLKDGDASRAQKPPPPTSLFGRMTQGFRSSASSSNLLNGLDVIRQVDAKYPALLFKEQLAAYVETMYGILRDNFKRELSPLLSLCIQAPRTNEANLKQESNHILSEQTPEWLESSNIPDEQASENQKPGDQTLDEHESSSSQVLEDGTSGQRTSDEQESENTTSNQTLTEQESELPGNPTLGTQDPQKKSMLDKQWQCIIDSVDGLLKTFQDNFVPPYLAQKFILEIFSFINVQLFNSLLQRRECCSFKNGEYVKSGLEELELWCAKAKEEYVGSSWDELKHIRQAVGFLVIFHKSRVSYDEIVNDLCPVLNAQQIYRICTQYWDDKYDTHGVSEEVLSTLKTQLPEDSNDADKSLLLDEKYSIPFSANDLSTSLYDKGFAGVKPAEELLENPSFQFLKDPA